MVNDFKAEIKRICLVCDYNRTTSETKKDHKDIIPCPKCNGSFVDVWVKEKYTGYIKEIEGITINIDIKSGKKPCEHDYRLLTDSIDMIECRADDEVKGARVEGMALFHCTKCLDIQKKVIT